MTTERRRIDRSGPGLLALALLALAVSAFGADPPAAVPRMDFVNAYATDADIETYRLNEIWDRYRPARRGDHYGGNRPNFTVDRPNQTFLLRLKIGRGRDGDLSTFLLVWQGEHVLAKVRQVGGSTRLDEDPFVMVWRLERLRLPPALQDRRAAVVEILKQGLERFGFWGAQRQIPNTVTRFEF